MERQVMKPFRAPRQVIKETQEAEMDNIGRDIVGHGERWTIAARHERSESLDGLAVPIVNTLSRKQTNLGVLATLAADLTFTGQITTKEGEANAVDVRDRLRGNGCFVKILGCRCAVCTAN
jgi:hypothetical protein